MREREREKEREKEREREREREIKTSCNIDNKVQRWEKDKVKGFYSRLEYSRGGTRRGEGAKSIKGERGAKVLKGKEWGRKVLGISPI